MTQYFAKSTSFYPFWRTQEVKPICDRCWPLPTNTSM